MSDFHFPFPGREASKRILHADPCFKKIPTDQVDEVFEKAWQTGEAAATQFLAQLDNPASLSMLQLLEKKNFRIEVKDVDYVMGNIRYFCEYMSEENIILIYRKSVELWAEKNRLSYEAARDLILAHEYFHYLEWHKIGRTSKQCLVPMLRIGKLSLGKTGIAALSEIGANAFANSCCTAILTGAQASQIHEQEE